MEYKFKYKCDNRCKWLTVIYIIFICVGLAALLIFGERGYMEAWLVSIFVAVIALYLLSIPRYVKVDDDNLEIQCVVELTRIDIRDIVTIRKVGPDEYKHKLFCLLGSYGFFGYYGYYFNFRNWELIKFYARERRNLVEIEDAYEQIYIISCREADELIDAVMGSKLGHIKGCSGKQNIVKAKTSARNKSKKDG